MRENACEGGQRARAEQAVTHLLAARTPQFEWTKGIGPQQSVESACVEGVKQVQTMSDRRAGQQTNGKMQLSESAALKDLSSHSDPPSGRGTKC